MDDIKTMICNEESKSYIFRNSRQLMEDYNYLICRHNDSDKFTFCEFTLHPVNTKNHKYKYSLNSMIWNNKTKDFEFFRDKLTIGTLLNKLPEGEKIFFATDQGLNMLLKNMNIEKEWIIFQLTEGKK